MFYGIILEQVGTLLKKIKPEENKPWNKPAFMVCHCRLAPHGKQSPASGEVNSRKSLDHMDSRNGDVTRTLFGPGVN